MGLEILGWSDYFTNSGIFKESTETPLRIVRENRGEYICSNGVENFKCEVSGKFRFNSIDKSDYPVVGDWVLVSVDSGFGIIHRLLPRKSVFSRKVPGELTMEQPVASNIDYIFIVIGLDNNFSLRRVERYLSLAWESGAQPIVILNKSDICSDFESKKIEVEEVAFGADVITMSALDDYGLNSLNIYLKPGITIAFLGSSGVGKSTIINNLVGSKTQDTGDVRSGDSKGRHTTTYSQLIVLECGAMVIDTPGMRELQVWGSDDGVEKVFNDINEIALQCRFSDCSHTNEPGCAVLEAIDSGTLETERYNSYIKLKKEYAYLEKRQSMSANAVERDKWKGIHKTIKDIKKRNK